MNIELQHSVQSLPAGTRKVALREVREQLGERAFSLRKAVVFLRPILDPDLGRGWRCTLHGFPHHGDVVVAVATGFEPSFTARLAAQRLAREVAGAPRRPNRRRRSLHESGA